MIVGNAVAGCLHPATLMQIDRRVKTPCGMDANNPQGEDTLRQENALQGEDTLRQKKGGLKPALQDGKPVLFVLLRAMGDVLLATPAIHAFKKAHPETAIDVLVEKIPAQPLRNNPDLRNVIIAPNRGSSISAYYPLIRILRQNKYQAVIDFQSTPGSALLVRLIRTPIRIGFERRMRSWAYTHTVKPENSASYAVLPKFNLLTHFIWNALRGEDSPDYLPQVFPHSTEFAAADQFLRQAEIKPDDIVLGLAPYCRREWRLWPVDKWRKLLVEYSKKNAITWLLFAGSNERESLKTLESIAGVRVIWVGMDDLLSVAALMSRCGVVVSGENGLLHLAVASGVPTFSIFCGRDEPCRWIPSNMKKHTALDLRGNGKENRPADVALALEAFLASN